MSEKQTDKPTASRAVPNPASPPGPETQKQRWMKYGANVVLASVVVVLLGIIFTALAQQSWAKLHVDTTEAGLYSLKPQTKAVLKDLKKDVRIVSLYTRIDPPAGKEKEHVDYATPVADLLGEYERYGGGRVTTEVIDPAKDPGKVEALVEDVTKRYAGEVAQYAGFTDGFRKRGEELQNLVAAEQAKVTAIDKKALAGSPTGKWVGAAGQDLGLVVQRFKGLTRDLDRLLGQNPKDYKAAVAEIRQVMTELSGFADGITARFEETVGDMTASPDARAYATESPARYAEMKKRADEVVAEIDKLGELKLDALVQTLQVREGIVVLGPTDMRVLPFQQVWQDDPNVRRAVAAMSEGKELKLRFAGEQQISAAILELTQDKKPKVAFVRAGGPPLASAASPFGGQAGPFTQVAARLRQYNFDVLEKDLTEQWAMESQRNGMPPMGGDEPSLADIKDAVWVVLALPQQPGRMGMPQPIAPKVADHLKAGGSAMVLVMGEAEDFTEALSDWGVKPLVKAAIVHQPVASEGAETGDMINEAQKNPYIFILNEYGTHVLADPIRSLDIPLVQAVPVQSTQAAGVTHWNLLPVPTDPPAWGETTLPSGAEEDMPKVEFDPAGDIQGPLFAGVAAQKEGGGRLIVMGTLRSFMNDILSFWDREMLRQGVLTSRFPGSGELFNNSVFWLAKMEPMIAISPAAMDVSRIEQMGPRAQTFWRNFVLLAGLPLLVVIAGGLMYVRRRD